MSGGDNGVYYNRNDYAPLLRRLLVACVDLIGLCLFAYLLSNVWSLWAEAPDIKTISEFGWLSAAIISPGFFWVVTVTAYFYLVVAKRSRLRTIGYRLFGLKVVDLNGKTPSLLKMSFRFILLVFGPFHLLIDLFWLGGDDNKQTLRDKFAGTYVIKLAV